MNTVDLKEMMGGALQEKFQHAFETVMKNMQDVNTPYKDKREINIKMTFVQNEMRDNVVATITVKEKLASQAEMMTQFAVGKDLRNDEIFVEEYGKQIKGQMAMDSRDIQRVDLNTGEIVEEPTGQVVDLRKAK